MDVVSFGADHLEPAARLFSKCYLQAREALPVLPARHESPEGALRLLGDLAGRAPGVVALEGGEVGGYVLGMPIQSFFGNHKGAYSPIWGHAAEG